GERRNLFDRRADRLGLVGEIPAGTRRRAEALLAVLPGDVRFHAVGDARRVRQPIANLDLSARRHDSHSVVGTLGDGRLGELGNEAAHRLGEPDAPFLDEHQDGRARDGLRLRGNAEDGVDPHRIARLAIPPADGLLVHDLAVLEYDGHETRDLLFLDVALEEPIEARAAVGRRWYRRCGR